MDEKTTKILFVLGMTLSFPVVLAVMVSLIDTPSTANKRSPRVTAPPPVRPTEAARALSTARADSTRHTAGSPSLSPPPADPSTAEPVPLRPDPEAVRQLATLKKGLQQELDALKQDRDTMLAALARELAQLSPAEAAAELRGLDDELIALSMRSLPADRRKAILAHFDAQRAGRIQRRVQALASR